jgi:hypothetical protein
VAPQRSSRSVPGRPALPTRKPTRRSTPCRRQSRQQTRNRAVHASSDTMHGIQPETDYGLISHLPGSQGRGASDGMTGRPRTTSTGRSYGPTPSSMGSKSDLLELIDGAPLAVHTLTGSLWTWSHHARARQAVDVLSRRANVVVTPCDAPGGRRPRRRDHGWTHPTVDGSTGQMAHPVRRPDRPTRRRDPVERLGIRRHRGGPRPVGSGRHRGRHTGPPGGPSVRGLSVRYAHRRCGCRPARLEG